MSYKFIMNKGKVLNSYQQNFIMLNVTVKMYVPLLAMGLLSPLLNG